MWVGPIVGRILKELDEDGLSDNTIVFLWSDHGEGLPRAKRWPYDAGIRIPLIVRWPGRLKPGNIADQLVSLVDLGATVLSLAGVQRPYHMYGRPFLGPEAEPREYVFATRDRNDEAYDMVRAVRDKQYKYIRNYFPEKPYLQWIPFSHQHAVFQEMWRLHREGKLKGAQKLMFQPRRPVEELYDCEKDPYEIYNLADDSAYADILKRMRAAMDDWRNHYGNMGDIPKAQMVAQMWPGGVQPQTATPIFVPINEQTPGIEPVNEGGVFKAPVHVLLHSSTQGASIAYTTELGNDARWQLYTEPLCLPVGTTTLRAKAVRIGYKDSVERSAEFSMEG